MKRLASPVEFRRTYREGRRASNDLLAVHVRSNGLGLSRVGFAVPSRIGTAVARNRVRRRLREAFHAARSLPAGIDIVVVPKEAAGGASFAALAAALQDLVMRAAGDRESR